MLYPNDPEGLFTTLSAFTNTLAGLAFSLLMRYNSKGDKIQLLKYWSLLTLTLVGLGLIAFFSGDEVCKKRWSISFALITSGLSGFALSLCFVVVDILDKPVIKEYVIQPFLWLGMNPLFIFVAMIAFDNLLMNNIKFNYEGRTINVWSFIEN